MPRAARSQDPPTAPAAMPNACVRKNRRLPPGADQHNCRDGLFADLGGPNDPRSVRAAAQVRHQDSPLTRQITAEQECIEYVNDDRAFT